MISGKSILNSITAVIALLYFAFAALQMPRGRQAYAGLISAGDIPYIEQCWLNNKTKQWLCEHYNVTLYGFNKFILDYDVKLYSKLSDENLALHILKYQQNNKETWGREMIYAALINDNSMHFFSFISFV